MEKLKEIAEWFTNFGITLYYVGGYCRDLEMGNPIEDVDICVVGGRSHLNVTGKLDDLHINKKIESYTTVHGSFPIWIVEINGEKYEFAMARKERKVGQSRQEFECEVNNVTIEEDLMRRDLTINAIARNVVTGEIIDPFGGVQDVNNKIAKAVSSAFKEDSLRVYRAARFIAKFDLQPDLGLYMIACDCDHTQISNERVGMELIKMFKTAKTPSKFFYFLKEIGWLQYHFPELHGLIGVPQSPLHHPEGDVWSHTMHCIDAVPVGDWFQRATMLCHDLGKAETTEITGDFVNEPMPWATSDYWLPEGSPYKMNKSYKITAHGHEKEGVELTKSMLKRIHFTSHDEIDRIACLVELHMIRSVISEVNYDKIVRRTLRKLMKYKLEYSDLIRTVHYDLSGRPPRPIPKVEQVAKELYYEHNFQLINWGEMEPIVTGKMLIDSGMKEGPEIGVITKHALELQDRGTLRKDNWKKMLKGCGYKFFNQKTES